MKIKMQFNVAHRSKRKSCIDSSKKQKSDATQISEVAPFFLHKDFLIGRTHFRYHSPLIILKFVVNLAVKPCFKFYKTA